MTQCVPSWSTDSERTFHIVKTIVLYTLPLLFMSVAYCQIVRVLWRSDNIPGHTETMRYQETSCNNLLNSNRRNTVNPANANITTEGQLRSRRKAAKMLVAVVVMFAICYLPVHLLSILRYTMEIPQNHTTVVIAMLSHWLCYANSAVNPIIYNFMSGKFRKEFRRTFGSWCCREKRYPRGRRDTAAHSSTFICRFTTGGSTFTARTEIVPLSGLTSNCHISDVD
ncbi:orexin receptor type 2 [Anabrus simplex]|uniref:orexin receptor type 2 n=1 Tax=Anabrus simplex TaxID=316456 RepID=UPI0034DCE3C4